MLHKAYKCIQLCSQTSFGSPSLLSSRCRLRGNLERSSDSLMSCFEDLLAWHLPPSPSSKSRQRARWPRSPTSAWRRWKSRRKTLRLTGLQQVNLKSQMSQHSKQSRSHLCTFEAVNRKSPISLPSYRWFVECLLLTVTKVVLVVRKKWEFKAGVGGKDRIVHVKGSGSQSIHPYIY